MRVTLLSHGATGSTRANAFPVDEPLEERARFRLADLSRRLGRADRIVTSPALQARETAAGLDLAAAVDPALRGWDYGRWAGSPIEAVGRGEPDALHAWRHDPTSRAHGGESLDDLRGRAAAWLDRQNDGPRLLAITHPCVIRAAVVHALASGTPTFWHLDIGPLTAVSLSFGASRWTLKAVVPL